MKKTILGLFLGLSVMGMAASESTTLTETVSNDLHIKATVVQPLSIVETTSMDFGTLVSAQAAVATTPGVMDIDGDDGAEIIITTEKNATIIGPDSTAVIVALTPSVTGKTNLGTDGKLTQTIGGSIKANATKESGEYTGTTTISVKYN